MHIKDEKYKSFVLEFEDKYLTRGFGSMNKNELEVLFFYLYKEYGDINGKSNFTLAKELKITESKVKKLSYEAELVYGNNDTDTLRGKFLDVISHAKIQKENDTLRFAVEDKFLRSSIYEDLKQEGYYLDSSFNSEIVSIRKEPLIFLLDQYFKEEQKQEIVDAYKAAIKKTKTADKEKISFSGVMSMVLGKLLEKGAEKTLDFDYSQAFITLFAGINKVAMIIKVIGFIFTTIV